jgi:hypothetical protein
MASERFNRLTRILPASAPWYVAAWVFLAAKVVTVVEELRPLCGARPCVTATLIAGKILPALICFAFYNDALTQNKRTKTFWLWMLALVPAFTILVIFYKRL